MSDNYIVSARKYRPQTFDTVVGQDHITTTLKNAIRHNHLAHAYLFCGPRGVGKTTCARILAKTINCENPTADIEACGVCATCQSFNNNTSFNVFELDAASNNSVDDIRNLTDQVRFAPQQGKYKIYIIDEVHMLSASAFNAFLKTLEEPPPYAIFILATTEKHKILPTILSRCQIFDFKRITTNDIVAHLHGIATKEGVIAQEAGLHVIAQKSEGCMRDALSMLDRIVSFTNGMLTYQSTMEHLNLLDADFYFKLTDNILSQDVSATLLILDEALERGFEGDVILEGMAEHLRNLLLCKDARMAKLLDVPNDHKPVYHEKANQTPPSFIISGLNVVNDSELNYKNANNKRLHVEMCLIRLCYVLQATDLKKNDSSDAEPLNVKSPSGVPITIGIGVNSYQPASAPAPQPIVSEPAAAPIVAATVHNEPAPAPAKQEPVKPQPTNSPQPVETEKSPSGDLGVRRRISKNLMEDIDAAVNNSHSTTHEAKELTAEMAAEVFAKYVQAFRDANKSAYYAQFSQMTTEVNPPEEVKIIVPTHFSVEYVKEQRSVLIDFFRAQTGIPTLRVVPEVRENADAIAGEQKMVLSKQEIYEVMAAKNPVLSQLKDALNLTIEY